jgi:hypothetical protein
MPRTEGMERQDAKNARIFREPDRELDELAHDVVDAAVEVHRVLGPGFVESVYEQGRQVGQHQLDLLIADRLIVELKAVESLAPIHGVQLRSYLKATGRTLGLLINFNVPLLRQGIRKVILTP